MSGSNSSAPEFTVPGAPLERAAPEPLSFTVHQMPLPSPAEAQRTHIGRVKMLLVVLVCAAPVIASYFTYYVIRPQGRTNYGELIDAQPALPSLKLKNLQGQTVNADSLKGQWLFVTAASGACQATCERNLYLQRQLRETLGRDRDRMDKVWFVTDEAPAQRALQKGVGSDTQVLRVAREELARWLAPAQGQVLEDHLYVVDPLGHWMMRFPAEGDPDKIKRDLTKLMRGSASWDQAGR